MPIVINLRHLDAHNVRLQGELDVKELDIDPKDEVIQVSEPLCYDLEVQNMEDGLLVQGSLQLILNCECVRCLKDFSRELAVMDWKALVPLQGEDAVPVVNDCVDLTPLVREDILLEFPQHPLCEPDCGGLPKTEIGRSKTTSSTESPEGGSTAWDELNKLKF